MSNSSVSSALLEGAARPHEPSQPYTSNLTPTDSCLPHINTSHLTSEAAADTRLRRESLEPGHRWAHAYLKKAIVLPVNHFHQVRDPTCSLTQGGYMGRAIASISA